MKPYAGEKSRDFFVKSGLGNDKLLQIWCVVWCVTWAGPDIIIGTLLILKIAVLLILLTSPLECTLFKDSCPANSRLYQLLFPLDFINRLEATLPATKAASDRT